MVEVNIYLMIIYILEHLLKIKNRVMDLITIKIKSCTKENSNKEKRMAGEYFLKKMGNMKDKLSKEKKMGKVL